MKPTEFKTKSGKVFDLSINYAIAKTIDDDDFSEVTEVPICFIDQSSVEMFQELNKNSSLVFAIIWTIIQDQVKDNKWYSCKVDAGNYIPGGITKPICKLCNKELGFVNSGRVELVTCDKASILFLKDLDGTAIQQAKAAFKEGLYDFFPQMRTYLSELEKVKEAYLREIEEKHSVLVKALIQNTDRIVREELEKIKKYVGEENYNKGRFTEAVELFDKLISGKEFSEFLTLPAYARID